MVGILPPIRCLCNSSARRPVDDTAGLCKSLPGYSFLFFVRYTMSKLFTPYNLSGLALKNRVVMAPMTRTRTMNDVPDEVVALYGVLRRNPRFFRLPKLYRGFILRLGNKFTNFTDDGRFRLKYCAYMISSCRNERVFFCFGPEIQLSVVNIFQSGPK